MSRRYESNNDKRQDNAISSCPNCGDCVVISDSSDNGPRHHQDASTSSTEKSSFCQELSEGEAYRLNTNGRPLSTVKIIVSQGDDSKQVSTSEAPDLYEDKNVSTSDDDRKKVKKGSNFNMKHICFSFCNGNGKNNNRGACPAYNRPVPSSPKQSSGRKKPGKSKTSWCKRRKKDKPQIITGCPRLDEYIAQVAHLNQQYTPPSNNDYNNVMVPKNPCCDSGCCGDGNLENTIKNEMHGQSRCLDALMDEIKRQRRDLREIQATLECMMRFMRDQVFMNHGKMNGMTNGKANVRYNEMEDRLDHKNDLDRKSKTTSLWSGDDDEDTTDKDEKEEKRSPSRKRGKDRKEKKEEDKANDKYCKQKKKREKKRKFRCCPWCK